MLLIFGEGHIYAFLSEPTTNGHSPKKKKNSFGQIPLNNVPSTIHRKCSTDALLCFYTCNFYFFLAFCYAKASSLLLQKSFIIMKNARLIPKWRIKIHGNKRVIKTQGGTAQCTCKPRSLGLYPMHN